MGCTKLSIELILVISDYLIPPENKFAPNTIQTGAI